MAQPFSRLFCRRFSSLSTSPVARSSIFRTQRGPINSTSHTFKRFVGGAPKPPKLQITLLPFIAIFGLGTGAYILMVQSRLDSPPSEMDQIASPKKDVPVFNKDNVTVLFVLGGPGAGKGTQCANLVRDYNFTHLSAGDLLRAEQTRPGSQFGALINDYIKEGKIVPMEVTVQLLENAMTEELSKQNSDKGKFLIDGFPRKMDQAVKFEETVCPARFVLFFDCPEEEMEKRLLNRGKTSGRSDDNAESIKKRFRTFVETSMPVVDYFEDQGRLVKILAKDKPETVYEQVKKGIAGKI